MVRGVVQRFPKSADYLAVEVAGQQPFEFASRSDAEMKKQRTQQARKKRISAVKTDLANLVRPSFPLATISSGSTHEQSWLAAPIQFMLYSIPWFLMILAYYVVVFHVPVSEISAFGVKTNNMPPTVLIGSIGIFTVISGFFGAVYIAWAATHTPFSAVKKIIFSMVKILIWSLLPSALCLTQTHSESYYVINSVFQNTKNEFVIPPWTIIEPERKTLAKGGR